MPQRGIRKLVLLESAPDDYQPLPLAPAIQGQWSTAAEVEVERPDRDADEIVDENVVDKMDSVKESLSGPARSRERNPYNVDFPSKPRRSQRIAEKTN